MSYTWNIWNVPMDGSWRHAAEYISTATDWGALRTTVTNEYKTNWTYCATKYFREIGKGKYVARVNKGTHSVTKVKREITFSKEQFYEMLGVDQGLGG